MQTDRHAADALENTDRIKCPDHGVGVEWIEFGKKRFCKQHLATGWGKMEGIEKGKSF